MQCPHCSTKSQIKYSRLHGWELLWLIVLRRPYRCLRCGLRWNGFWRFFDSSISSSHGTAEHTLPGPQ